VEQRREDRRDRVGHVDRERLDGDHGGQALGQQLEDPLRGTRRRGPEGDAHLQEGPAEGHLVLELLAEGLHLAFDAKVLDLAHEHDVLRGVRSDHGEQPQHLELLERGDGHVGRGVHRQDAQGLAWEVRIRTKHISFVCQ
jgi:hypothetical protein